jgi:hypothetical protein
MKPSLQSWASLCVLFLLVSCTPKPASVPPPVAPDSGQIELPQRPDILPEVVFDVPQLASQAVPVNDQPLLGPGQQALLHQRLLERFFAPWHLAKPSLSMTQAFGAVRAYGSKPGYAENLQPYPRDRWERIVALQNMAAYPSRGYPAIVTRNTSMRLLPSLRPFFLDPAKPGEGFPFDYFQHSALWMGTPVYVCHESLDRAWLFVETAVVNGWVRSEDVARAEPDFRSGYETRSMAALTLDDTPLVGAGGFLGQTHIGAMFPLHGQTSQGLTVRVPVRSADGRAEIGLADLNPLQAAPMPLALTSRAVAGLADAMSGQLYGWGGMFENRDCSSTLRDLFLPFGVWLPRNSGQQAREGGMLVSLEKMDGPTKLAAIRTRGVPFASFISMPGHIGLYLGPDVRGEPLMLHNIWGVRTTLPDGGEGRAVVGRLVITTLRPGEDRPDVRGGAFLERVRGLTILAAPPAKK